MSANTEVQPIAESINGTFDTELECLSLINRLLSSGHEQTDQMILELARKFPESIDLQKLRGLTLLKNKEWTQASKCFVQLIENLRPNADKHQYIYLARAQHCGGDTVGALGTLREAMTFFPNDRELTAELDSIDTTQIPTEVVVHSVEALGNHEYSINVEYRCGLKNAYLNLDMYPFSDPRHPERHLGYWSFALPRDGEGRRVSFRLNLKNKSIQSEAGLECIDSWVGKYNSENEFNVTATIYQDGKPQARTVYKAYFGSVYALEDIKLQKEPLKSAVWFLTWKCNFKCSYCWEVQRIIKGELAPEPFKDYREWVVAWNKLKPQILDISGGEPFLQPNFMKLLQELDDSIQVAITTNLSFDVTEFVQNINPKKIRSLTFSLHPTQKMSLDQFIGRVLLIKNRGFGPITVNFVTWPEQLWMIGKYKKIFENEIGVRFHVDPYAATPHFPYTFSDTELKYMQQFTGSDREHFYGGSNEFNVACSGGMNHISVEPDGTAYRCIQDKVTGQPSLGNILQENFRLNEKKTFCDQFFQCPGCDRDKVDVLKVAVPFKKSIKLMNVSN